MKLSMISGLWFRILTETAEQQAGEFRAEVRSYPRQLGEARKGLEDLMDVAFKSKLISKP